MSDVQINLVCCTQVIKNEIEHGVSQKDIALTYAIAIKSYLQGADQPDWKEINAAILGRWKMSGLERIKRRAYGIYYGRIQP